MVRYIVLGDVDINLSLLKEVGRTQDIVVLCGAAVAETTIVDIVNGMNEEVIIRARYDWHDIPGKRRKGKGERKRDAWRLK